MGGTMKTTVNILLASVNATNTTDTILPMYNNKGKICSNFIIHAIKVVENDVATLDQGQQQYSNLHPSAPQSSTVCYPNDVYNQAAPSHNPHFNNLESQKLGYLPPYFATQKPQPYRDYQPANVEQSHIYTKNKEK